jgi:hypothetical protein
MRVAAPAQNRLAGVVPDRIGGTFEVVKQIGGSSVKRFVVALLIALVGVPWTAIPAAKASACAMPRATSACSYCSPAPNSSASVPTLESGCCRFSPNAERVTAQAGSLGSTPKPSQSPDVAASMFAHEGVAALAAQAAASTSARVAAPPHSPPTRTTHLLL